MSLEAFSRSEILNFLANAEEFERTLARFPGLTRDDLRALLREAVLLFRVEASPPHSPQPPPAPRPTLPTAATALSPSPSSNPREAPPALPARRLRVFTDGASRGNPGPSGAGAVIAKIDGTVVKRLGRFLGSQTNNFAEYSALLLGLEAAHKLGATEVEVYADSELMIRQLEGKYQVKAPGLKPLYAKARLLLITQFCETA